MLSPGSSPIYDFPPNWNHDIFFINESGENVCKFTGKGKRVYLPEFEMSCKSFLSIDDAHKKVSLEILQYMANTCIFLGLDDCRVIMPIRSDMVLRGNDRSFTAAVVLGIMVTHDDGTTTDVHNPSWVPNEIHDIAEFAANIEDSITIIEVMTE